MQPFIKSSRRYPLFFLALFGLAGCASLPDALQPSTMGGAAAAAAEALPATPEGQLLASLGGAAPGADILLPDGVRAVADEAYAAASGRTCRQTRLDYPDGRVAHRLACEIEGRWQWVPAVILPQNG